MLILFVAGVALSMLLDDKLPATKKPEEHIEDINERFEHGIRASDFKKELEFAKRSGKYTSTL